MEQKVKLTSLEVEDTYQFSILVQLLFFLDGHF